MLAFSRDAHGETSEVAQFRSRSTFSRRSFAEWGDMRPSPTVASSRRSLRQITVFASQLSRCAPKLSFEITMPACSSISC